MGSVEADRVMASIVKINDIKPINGADLIELAIVNGWQCVVKKGDFTVGDMGIYICIDSVPDFDDPNFQFMKDKKLKKVKTIKMKGEISQGLLGPLCWLKSRGHPVDNLVEGDDVTKQMGITKHVEHEEIDQYTCTSNKPFPSCVPKTDEERLQNKPKFIKDILGRQITITRKEDGCSCTFIVRNYKIIDNVSIEDDESNDIFENNESSSTEKTPNIKTVDQNVTKMFDVCGRNFILTQPEGEQGIGHYFHVAEKYKVKENLMKFCVDNERQLAIQGEVVGPKINGNKLKLTEYLYRVFNIYDIERNKYLLNNEVLDICKELGLETVPELWSGLADNFSGTNSVKLIDMIKSDENNGTRSAIGMFLNYADTIEYNQGEVAEGIVVKTCDTNGQRISFKVISNKFLLKQEEISKKKKEK